MISFHVNFYLSQQERDPLAVYSSQQIFIFYVPCFIGQKINASKSTSMKLRGCFYMLDHMEKQKSNKDV
jgi:hypothetical protein